MNKKKMLVCIGTRADAIKMCPLYLALKRAEWAEPILLCTGQHREMAGDVLGFFSLRADVSLVVMKRGQEPHETAERVAREVTEVIRALSPELVLVHGDTASALGCAEAAHSLSVRVAHIEAGLRSGDERDPYPEEIFRKRISALSTYHLAPTQKARENLKAEGVEDEYISLVGNTVTDAVSYALERQDEALPSVRSLDYSGGVVLFTLHRRESIEGEENAAVGIFRALGRLLDAHESMTVLFPIHKNERVRELFSGSGVSHPRLIVCEPLDYPSLIYALSRSSLVMTDSGGICEEAGYLGIPTMIIREHTERTESVEGGCALLTGTEENTIFDCALELFTNEEKRSALRVRTLAYGNGGVCDKIVEFLKDRI